MLLERRHQHPPGSKQGEGEEKRRPHRPGRPSDGNWEGGGDGEAARQVRQTHDLPAIVLTCGREGVVAIDAQGVVQAQAPVQRAVNAAGAGEATSAAIVWRRALGDGWAETLRWAAAVSAASVTTEATAEVRLADVEHLLPDVRIITHAAL